MLSRVQWTPWICATVLLSVCVGDWRLVAAPPAAEAAQGESARRQVSANQPKKKSKQKEEEKTDLQKFMRKKLAGSNLVLEGLVTNDFKQVLKGTTELKRISKAAEWRISNDIMYRQYSGEFRRKVDRLEQAAKKKDADAAALKYIEVTMSCIECHTWVAAVLVADRDAPPPLRLQTIAYRNPQERLVKQNRPQSVKTFMRGKLNNAKGILEGLVTSDFDMVQKEANLLNVMSRAAAWQVFKTKPYEQHSFEFRRNVRQLVEAAKKDDAESATLSYLKVTMSCLNCHKHVRGAKTAWSVPRLQEHKRSVAIRFDRGPQAD